MTTPQGSPQHRDPRRIVLVGTCASGKSTLAERLRMIGHDVHVCGQEHSAIANLWQRSHPDVLVALDVDLETVRLRRSPTWSRSLYETQRTRLAKAFSEADLVVDTASQGPDDVARAVVRWLDAHPISSD